MFTIVIIWTIVAVAAIIGGSAYIVYDLVVKGRRRREWVADHGGCLIGSEKFFVWCNEVGIDPRYYL